MKILFYFSTLSFLSLQLLAAPTLRSRFEGVNNIGLDGVIESGEIETKQKEIPLVQREIKTQLSYLVGALNGWGGTIDLARSEITVGERNEATGRTSYSAKIFVSWPKAYSVPQVFNFPLPLRADSTGLNDFYSRYSNQCSENPGSHELDVGSFFYYYRPQNNRCPASYQSSQPENVSFPSVKVGISSLNTRGKSPEYGKVWEDGELTATIIIGSYESGATSNSDVGIAQYNSMYRNIRAAFGQPVSMNVSLSPNAIPGVRYPDIEMAFDFGPEKKMNLVLFLIDKNQLQNPSEAFKARFQERMELSDLISYNGHSGLGSNIRALIALGKYKKDKYQVFYLNGCDTFSYIDNTLAEMHQKVNPDFDKYKFVDFISNSMPSPFNGFHVSNFSLLNAMLGKHDTYRGILERFGSYQKAVVMGEEDNNWPKPF